MSPKGFLFLVLLLSAMWITWRYLPSDLRTDIKGVLKRHWYIPFVVVAAILAIAFVQFNFMPIKLF